MVDAEAGFSVGADDAMSGGTGRSAPVVDPKYLTDVSSRAGFLLQDGSLPYVRGDSNVGTDLWLTHASNLRSGKDS